MERLLDAKLSIEDLNEESLRPRTLDEYIGQQKVKEKIRIFIEAAKKGKSRLTMYFCMDHQGLARQP